MSLPALFLAISEIRPLEFVLAVGDLLGGAFLIIAEYILSPIGLYEMERTESFGDTSAFTLGYWIGFVLCIVGVAFSNFFQETYETLSDHALSRAERLKQFGAGGSAAFLNPAENKSFDPARGDIPIGRIIIEDMHDKGGEDL